MNSSPQPTTEGRRERKKREVRERILRVTQKAIARRGFDAVTIEEISDKADISQATFFNYFENKRTLLRALVDETLDTMHAFLEQKRSEGTSAAATFEDYFRVSAHAVVERSVPRELLLEIIRTATPVGSGDEAMSRIHASFEAIVRGGQTRGDVRKDLDARFLAEMVFGIFAAVFTNWLNDRRYPVEQRAREAAQLVGESIAPRAAKRKRKS